MKTLEVWNKHKEEWNDCRRCYLSETRGKVVLAKGKIPCDILFIGEAPGISEDTIGKPFVGPAGELLDSIIMDAVKIQSLRYAFTNVIGCIPIDDGVKIHEPPIESIIQCSRRVEEFIGLCRPKLIVTVGRYAGDTLSSRYSDIRYDESISKIHIAHPSSILRANLFSRQLLIDNCIDKLKTKVEEVFYG